MDIEEPSTIPLLIRRITPDATEAQLRDATATFEDYMTIGVADTATTRTGPIWRRSKCLQASLRTSFTYENIEKAIPVIHISMCVREDSRGILQETNRLPRRHDVEAILS